MWNVFYKELLEIVRDKRALIFMLVMPAIVIPALLFGYAWVAGSKQMKEQEKILRYSVIASDGAPILLKVLAEEKHLQAVATGSEKEAVDLIKKDKLDFAILYRSGGESAILAGTGHKIFLQYNTATVFDSVGERIKPVLEGRYIRSLRERKLQSIGMSMSDVEAINTPFALEVKSTASDRERQGETLGAMLPYILLMLGFAASASVAIDIGAGEKERGTLESLLLLPISRTSIVLAKFFVILLVGAISGTIGITSLALCTIFVLQAGGFDTFHGIIESVHISDFILLALLMLPAYGIISALQLAVSIFARSHKEAAAYSNQLMIFMLTPMAISLLPGMKLRDGWFLVPITNISLAVKEIVKGTPNYFDSIVVFSSTLAVACLLLTFCIIWCRQETVLFRS
jgi:sodium transport system permease protein